MPITGGNIVAWLGWGGLADTEAGAADYPETSDVRAGVDYDFGALTGTWNGESPAAPVEGAAPQLTQQYADALQVVYEYLILASTMFGASPLHSAVGSRVFIGTLPTDAITDPCIVVKDGAGDFHAGAPVELSRIELDCYGTGDDLESARSVSKTATYQLHRAKNVRVTSGAILSAARIGGGSAIWTPPGVRPFVPVFFRVVVKP